VVLGATAVLLAGCTRAPEVALAPSAGAPECASPAWPATVSSLGRVTTTPESRSVAAWGDPAIIARCGLPALTPTTLECVTVNGVDWVVRELTDGSAATTYGTDPAIEVLVPDAYGPVPLLLPAFTAAAQALPDNGRACL
jgi:hypothetical protein